MIINGKQYILIEEKILTKNDFHLYKNASDFNSIIATMSVSDIFVIKGMNYNFKDEKENRIKGELLIAWTDFSNDVLKKVAFSGRLYSTTIIKHQLFQKDDNLRLQFFGHNVIDWSKSDFKINVTKLRHLFF